MSKSRQKRRIIVSSGCVALVAAAVITQGQLFSISAHLIRQATSPELTGSAKANPNPTGSRADFVYQPREASKPVTLLAVGDIADCHATTVFGKIGDNLLYSAGYGSDMMPRGTGHLRTEQLVSSYRNLPVLALGDLAYKSGSTAEFRHCYHPTWGRHKVRTFPTPGNHEYRSFGALGYFNYWGDRAGPGRRGYYSIRSGKWLLLSLNSEVGIYSGSRQFDWIVRTLDGTHGDCVLAFFHSPAYSSRQRKNSDRIKPLFRLLHKLGVTVVLNGHNHFYERTKPLSGDGAVASDDGMLTFIVGTGGKVRKRNEKPSPISNRMITETNGVLKLDLRDSDFQWQFIAADGQRVLDEGTAPCRDRNHSGN